ncbi:MULTISPECIES: helicase HerA-like domain-containing protein [unclassified Leifsonia]|uniref:helicase HerA-like domain-containing protein n=1 Tax=unclassified Leifsonia TaxID=2663824 RepID=UPI0006F45E4E|nr:MULTISPECIES: helicase HerA-like domain-containing protein [unclassified Leifsonia]KQX05634.1 ATPase [Leifsonia sp. Root1293]KRA09269.1 ATPase [Leifsonia sp. Root60]
MSDEVQKAQAAAIAAAEEAERLQAAAQEAVLRAQEAAESARAAAASADASASESAVPASVAQTTAGPLEAEQVAAIRDGYAIAGAAIEMGSLVNGEPLADVQVRIPLGMMNRHGLVAGATGTGKTRTLQGLAEQLSANGVAVFAADIKGDLSGIATPGQSSEKLIARTKGIGQDWTPASFPVEYFSLGGIGNGVPIRATLAGFGPLLLSKALGLNATQESSLGLVFHYAEEKGLALLDLADLRAVLTYLVGDEGKAELVSLGGLSSATVGVILRELIVFADGGADVFFGEPEIDTSEFLRVAADGRGIISLLEVPGVADKPALYSTFLMWLLADLFNDLPEVGDLDKPKLVFFFDEAHLLFADASKDFLAQIVQTVRLIRSKGVGIFFVTQTPKDVPADVLAQLGSRVQHQLRAFTPDDAKALRATVTTYPKSGYDLAEVLTTLGTGEAIVTVMNEKGAPSPVAWTRLRAPQGLMSPTPETEIAAAVAASPLQAVYGTAVDRESASEILTAKMNAAAAAAQAVADAEAARKAEAEYAKQAAAISKQADAEAARAAKARRAADAEAARAAKEQAARAKAQGKVIGDVLGSRATRTILNGVLEGIFGTRRRR